MSSWLHRQRKGDLVELAKQAGVSDYDGLLKDELVSVLDEHLRANSSSLSSNAAFNDFYRTASPVKKERAASTTSGPDVPKKRRTTKVKDEIEAIISGDDTPIQNLVARTPRLQRIAQSVPLPASPAEVADVIDRQTTIAKEKISSAYAKLGVTENIESVRESLSSVVGVELLVLGLEYYGLQKETLPWRYAFDFPAIGFLGTNSHPVSIPDFFLLVTSFFWAPTSLWAATSILLPALAAYFINFTLNGKSRSVYQADPLTFNVAKALITWLVYSQGAQFAGLVSPETAARVNAAVPGGYTGVLIGSGVGALASIYEAVLKR
ncbi:hypothetical protein M501DRAFT_924955 [Patellaria atrata CBS 101060]|uniref:Rho termination factor N-terminal domain-containing protein n=1 Tax=Patellaria atrata CBS 101060 TaxID=1346257 RepID=A0A9P4VWD6_9PEZI|nr:hypothetical protein M501DRAFT_924955 [Patellaria atrata CBS 101060]